MALHKFGPNDIFVSRTITNPKVHFLIYSGSYYYNNRYPQSGTWSDPVLNVNTGSISLYELNVDRPSNSFIYPYITKGSTLTSFKTISQTDFMSDFDYGDEITGSYPMSASLVRRYYPAYGGTLPIATTNVSYRKHIMALKNVLKDYVRYSPYYQYSASSESALGGWNKDVQEMTMLSIPSIFYGSSIKRGSVDLKFYVTGTVVGQLRDLYHDGNLIQQSGSISTNDGKVAGSVLYNQGIILLTGSWGFAPHVEEYTNGVSTQKPAWIYFGSTGSAANDYLRESSYVLDFKGVEKIPNITMFAHAKKNQLNNSSNPSFVEKQDSSWVGFSYSSGTFYEATKLPVKNIVKSVYNNYTASFQRETYISEIGIYDEKQNLIAIAKLATPVKKTEDTDYAFKLKVDI
jgi:hypothetical protein